MILDKKHIPKCWVAAQLCLPVNPPAINYDSAPPLLQPMKLNTPEWINLIFLPFIHLQGARLVTIPAHDTNNQTSCDENKTNKSFIGTKKNVMSYS